MGHLLPLLSHIISMAELSSFLDSYQGNFKVSLHCWDIHPYISVVVQNPSRTLHSGLLVTAQSRIHHLLITRKWPLGGSNQPF